MAHSKYLSGLNTQQRAQLERRLHDRQNGRCFICDELVDLVLHKGQLDIDHINPLIKDGLDAENNFGLTHASCNRSKGASNLEVARRLAEFEKLQERATKARPTRRQSRRCACKARGRQGIVAASGVRMTESSCHSVKLATTKSATNPLLHDKLSGMNTFFASVPLKCFHHDDRINPRSIGSSIRGLIEEFLSKNPQLHVALAWWAP